MATRLSSWSEAVLAAAPAMISCRYWRRSGQPVSILAVATGLAWAAAIAAAVGASCPFSGEVQANVGSYGQVRLCKSMLRRLHSAGTF